MSANRPLVIGIGNEFRADDAFGLLVAKRLSARPSLNADILTHHGEGTGLMALWSGRSKVVVVDAVSSGAPTGSLHVVDAKSDSLPLDWKLFSSHAFGLAQAIELSRSFNELPREFWVVGAEGSSFAQGAPLSAQLEDAIAPAVEKVIDLLIPAA